MKILVVEDDEHKFRQVAEVLAQRLPQAQVIEAQSYRSGLGAAMAQHPDLVVLDMSLPTYDIGAGESGGRPKTFGGRFILRELRRKGIQCKVIVVTQFPRFGEGDESMTLAELDHELRAEFGAMYAGTIYYHPSQSDWRDELWRAIQRALGK